MRHFIAVGFIWFCCAVAWVILGSTIMARSGETSSELREEVNLLWGPPAVQHLPRAVFHEIHKKKERVTTRDAQGRDTETEVIRDEDVEIDLPVDGSDIAVKLALQHRQKGLLWFPTYGVDFHARYTFWNNTREPRHAELRFPLGNDHAVFDGFVVTRPDGAPVDTAIDHGTAQWTADLAPGERRQYVVAYRSRGTTRWGYELSAGTGQARHFKLALDTDFRGVDFAAGTLSPSSHHVTDGGWHGEWAFESLVANSPIGLELPQKLNPGPLASRITFFAPVGLLFFFFVVAVLAAAQRKRIHPRDWFLIGCAFFAFHLLFAYLVDHLAILPAFAVASGTACLLVVSYARLFVGWRFALREMGIAQLIYLVLFSFTFFWTGFTGLAITIGAILTLFVMMQVTGRVQWEAPAPSVKGHG